MLSLACIFNRFAVSRSFFLFSLSHLFLLSSFKVSSLPKLFCFSKWFVDVLVVFVCSSLFFEMIEGCFTKKILEWVQCRLRDVVQVGLDVAVMSSKCFSHLF